MMRRALVLASLVGSLWAAHGTVLYDAAVDPAWNTRNLLLFASNAPIAPSGSALGTTLDTTLSPLIQAGFVGNPMNPLYPVLDRSGDGYTVRLDLRILSEIHLSADRAGFSLIALSSDLMGIELGFWGNEIWAQSGPAFTHAESAPYLTGGPSLTRYDLAIAGGGYQLYAAGAPLLAGPLRDYSPFGFPYNTPNFLFLGDDTTSALGAFEFGRVEILDAAVPEPGSLVLLLAGTGLLLRRRPA